MQYLPKFKLRPKGSMRKLGVLFYAVPCCLRSGCLRGRTCFRNVAPPFRACRFALHPAANAAHSKLLRVALSIDHCVAFELAFPMVLAGSHRRDFEIRAWSVPVAVPILKWRCLGAVFGLGRAVALLEAPSCVLWVRLSIDN